MLKNKNFRVHLGLLLIAGLATTTYSSPLISRLKRSSSEEIVINPAIETTTTYSKAPRYNRSKSTPAEGTYLYGQSYLPEQIGKEYLVFTVKRDRVVGAIYYPRSEFACFYGNLKEDKMDLRIVHPYDKSVNPYSIPLQASPGNNSRLSLQGYQHIETISNNDFRILNTCTSEYHSNN